MINNTIQQTITPKSVTETNLHDIQQKLRTTALKMARVSSGGNPDSFQAMQNSL